MTYYTALSLVTMTYIQTCASFVGFALESEGENARTEISVSTPSRNVIRLTTI